MLSMSSTSDTPLMLASSLSTLLPQDILCSSQFICKTLPRKDLADESINTPVATDQNSNPTESVPESPTKEPTVFMESDYRLLRNHLQLFRTKLVSSDLSFEENLKHLSELLEFLDKEKTCKTWGGFRSNPDLQEYFIERLYPNFIEFLLDKVVLNWFGTPFRLEKNIQFLEYFVPTGIKDLWKRKRAYFSLNILVSRLSFTPNAEKSQEAQLRNIFLLNVTCTLLSNLLKLYLIHDFYEAIFFNVKANDSAKNEEWREFVSLFCSIPQRLANLMVLDENHRRRIENLEDQSMQDVYFFMKLGSDAEISIFDICEGIEMKEEEIETSSFAFAELFSKICRVGHARRIFSIGLIRVVCCCLSWGEANEEGYSKKLGINDDLVEVLKMLISTWSDLTFIKHATIAMQHYITSAILIIFGYLPKETLIRASIPTQITPGVNRWLQSSSEQVRKLGMVTAEILSELTDEPEKILNFGMAKDDKIYYLKSLIKVKDGLMPYISDKIEINESEVHTPLKHVKFEKIAIETDDYQEFNELITVKETYGENKLELGDSDDDDDDDDLVPYPMEEPSEDDSYIISSRKNGQRLFPPVYIIDLIAYLKSRDDPDKTEIGLQVASKLIRNKAGFGMELDEHAVELASTIISLKDVYQLNQFDENKNSALVALICGSPKIVVPCTILAAIAKGAQELAGISIEQKSPIKMISELDSITQQMSDTRISISGQLQGTIPQNKERRFSKRPMIESIRNTSTAINKFDALAANTFFFPLAAGWWNWRRDGNHEGLMYESMLIKNFITTLGIVVYCSTNTLMLIQITREYWELILSLRYTDDPDVISSLLHGICFILEAVHGRELAESFSRELIETREWISDFCLDLMQTNLSDERLELGARALFKINTTIKEYHMMLLSDFLPLS
ncbi:hypothetical protein G9A89_002288 [Geosiphon pyriformis]|nr:hypothetical protein G9A89_002288 [Geosiphon pyriformis]